ncbi:squalene/phytoene synthase family protein [Sphingomonas montana]|uniref:squalene/phytoene synthase family protein n=1 Tax=Sphingomonas montana TaxID=1843236 RepID=UPI00096F7B3E|nr:squalene/phytoene synthase family protein [Sphingomonas montana]
MHDPTPAGAAEPAIDPERTLALLHVPAARRGAIATLWRLDARLGAVVATTTDPSIGAIRLAWWRDALTRLDDAAAPAEPLLQDVAAQLLPHVRGAELAALAEGWGAIVEGDPDMLDEYGRGRGGVLFGLAARVLGGDVGGAAAMGAGWALVDLGWGQRDAAFRAAALDAAERALAEWDGRTPRGLRPLGMLAVLARRDVAAGPDADRRVGSAGRIAMMLRHRMFGR